MRSNTVNENHTVNISLGKVVAHPPQKIAINLHKTYEKPLSVQRLARSFGTHTHRQTYKDHVTFLLGLIFFIVLHFKELSIEKIIKERNRGI